MTDRSGGARIPGGADRTTELPAAGSGEGWAGARFEGGGERTDALWVGGGRALGGRYRMGALLATGGMGEVWAAEDLLLDRPVAVKLLGGALAGDGRAAERLRREARAAARLVHPNIARVLDLGEQDGRPYLVMELLEGESLAARLDRAGPMAPAEAVEVVAAVADALEAAHRAGVVHRDVKPGNVFLTSGGEVKVLDFGIASAAGEAALTTGGLLGTAAYLAPERALGHRVTPAADVYALGVVLYELLAGRRPFEAASDIELAMAHINAQPAPLPEVAPSTPSFLVAACERAMAKDPAARPPSAAAFAHLLHPPAPSSTVARGRRPVRAVRRGLLVVLLLGGLLLAVPALGGGLLPWVGGRVAALVDQEPGGAGTADPGTAPRATAPPVGGDDPGADDDPPAGSPVEAGGRDQRDDDREGGDSSGSGRSGGGGSGGGGSSGPG